MSGEGNISEAGPATAAENMQAMHSTQIFNNSSDMDYLTHIGAGTVAETLRKQSLYVKFDPLLAASPDSSTHSVDEELINSHLNSSDSNTTVVLGNANSSVGNLISVTPSKAHSPRAATVKYVESDQEEISKLHSLLLKKAQKEEALQEEIARLKSDCEQAAENLANAENQISELNATLATSQENEQKLKRELKDKIKGKQELRMVMEEYEKTISLMVQRRDEEQKEFESKLKKVEAERDSTMQHLNNLEIAFNDIHQKYERGKAVNETLKKNEEGLKKSLAEYEKIVKIVENKCEMLKSHTASQLEKANQELELITESYQNEQAKLNAMLRKAEVQISSLQDALDRKVKENQELTTICDELIVKISDHSIGNQS